MKIRKLGRLTITLLLILAVAFALNSYNLPTGFLQERTHREPTGHGDITRSSHSTAGSCPAGVICASSSSEASSSLTFRTLSSSSLTFRTLSSPSLTFRTLSSSSTRPECSYLGIAGTERNVTITTTILKIVGTKTNETDSTIVVTTCAIPGFPLEATIIGTVVGLLFIIISRSKSRRNARPKGYT